MKRLFRSAVSKRWLILMICLVPMFSCTTVQDVLFPPTQTPTPTATPTPTPTPTITPTPTVVPLAERKLRDIALRKSDLPSGYTGIDIPDVEEILGQMGGSGSEDLLENLETGFMSFFTSQEGSLFANMILVYLDEDSASAAYESLSNQMTAGEEMDVPLIGEECMARGASTAGIYSYAILWRYREAVLELDYVGKEDIGIEEMARLAQIVQSRLETG